jgi:prevent-host-death family protein
MTRTVSATEARIHLGEHLDRIDDNGVITVEHEGTPEAVLLSALEAEDLSSVPASSADWRQSLERARASFTRDLGDKPRPDFVQMIREMREERSAQLLDNLR